MKQENVRSLEQLSLYCHFCGIITIFIGMLVVYLDAIKSDMSHIQVGLFILITGYAFVKISAKLTRILSVEKQQTINLESFPDSNSSQRSF